MVSIALAARKQHGLSQHNVRTIRCTGVGDVGREIDRIQRRAILERQVSAKLPILQDRPQYRCAWKRINITGAQPAPHVEKRKPALESQVSLVLRAEAFKQSWNLGVRVVDGFGPDEAGQER